MEDKYEVPSPHEHEMAEVAEKERDGLTQKIALMTAILATLGALISYQSGSVLPNSGRMSVWRWH